MKINKILSIIQLSAMYVSLILLVVFVLPLNFSEGAMAALLIGGISFSIIAGIVATVIAIISIVSIFRHDVVDQTKYIMIYKIVAIPWFIGNFILCIMLIGGMLNPFFIIAIPVVIAILMFNTYVDMLSTTMMNFGYVISSLRNKKIKINAMLVWGVILEFFFCLDLVGAILVFVNNKKQLQQVEQ